MYESSASASQRSSPHVSRLLFWRGTCLFYRDAIAWGHQGSMRKDSSFSECMLLSVRRSGSRSSSLVKRGESMTEWTPSPPPLSSGPAVGLLTRRRSVRIRFSWRCSTDDRFSIPERSVKVRERLKGSDGRTLVRTNQGREQGSNSSPTTAD